MAYAHAAVSIANTATAIVAGDTSPVDRRSISVYNNGAATIYLGTSAVTTSTGFPLPPGSALSLDRAAADALYGIVASGTAELRYLTEEAS